MSSRDADAYVNLNVNATDRKTRPRPHLFVIRKIPGYAGMTIIEIRA